MRRAAKRDANEEEIVACLEAAGCAVQTLSDPGVPDLLVWNPRTLRYYLLEVKFGNEKFTPIQSVWHSGWPGPAHVVRTPQEALQVVFSVR